MKVILTEDVQGLGSIGDVADVAQGYANNFLIPRKLAILATPGNLKHWEEKREWIVRREAANRAEAEALAARIEGAKLKIVAKAGEEGRLYGSVTVKDIAAKILEDLKIEVDRKKILLPEPIKSAGEHEATVRVFKDLDAKISIEVVGELEEGVAPPVEEITESVKVESEEETASDSSAGTAEADTEVSAEVPSDTPTPPEAGAETPSPPETVAETSAASEAAAEAPSPSEAAAQTPSASEVHAEDATDTESSDTGETDEDAVEEDTAGGATDKPEA